MWGKFWRDQRLDWTKAGMAWGPIFATVWLAIAALFPISVQARGPMDEAATAAVQPLSIISVRQLPPQGQRMMALIYQGGPFAYDKDGVVFGNRERILPARPRGYYREYTVAAPHQRSRGARRIVCGGVRPVAPDACFYTADHYASFLRIVE